MQDVEHPKQLDGLFAIKTEVFEGPLELLLELIEKHKLLINDISLASVTDEYMRRVAYMEQSPLKETTHFVQLAATLLLIKSKSLLPVLDLTDEEEGSIENLQDRLKQYAIFRDAGKTILNHFGKHISFERKYIPYKHPIFVTDKYTDTTMLANSLKTVINGLPKKVTKPKVKVRKTVSLEEMMDKLRTRVEHQMKFGFRDFTSNTGEKTIIIIGFLAVLEMVKQGGVMVKQITRFEDIEIERDANTLPRYI